jgi:3-ketosteroid 9alpha-monooxygenase subunit A
MSTLDPISIDFRAPGLGLPKGWFVVADATEIGVDRLKPVTYLGQQLVVYRTRNGAAQVADAYCPHLGAHLASHDGHIENGQIVCPFHKWRWDGVSGRCAQIPYCNTLPPAAVALTLHPTREVDGAVLMWFDPAGGPPHFEPYVSSDFQQGAWIESDQRNFVTTCPFPDIFENLFDSAHIVQLHRAAKMPVMKAMEPRPYGLYVDYAIDPEAEDKPLKQLEMHLSGIALLSQHYMGIGWEGLFFIGVTPIDRERVYKRYRLYLKDVGSQQVLEQIGRPFVERFVFEVEQDLEVLNFKKHLSRPRLCGQDGPIHAYRRYAEAYYATSIPHQGAVAAPPSRAAGHDGISN